ncbi:MAG: PIG-L deacetylase family protein [Verrucomicrobiota bacterium]
MELLRKIPQRLTDPVFYQKWRRKIIRCFRQFTDQPQVTSLGGWWPSGKVVVVVAHPDDETFCSGLICELKERGNAVEVVCVTRGEGGTTGKWTPEELGNVRGREMDRACEILGVDRLSFLDHVDPVADEFRVYAPPVAPMELADQLIPFLKEVDVIVSHGSGGEYWHPAHLRVYEAVAIAVDHEVIKEAAWMTFHARSEDPALPELINEDDESFLCLDVTRHEEKRALALHCHESQISLFSKFASGDASDFIRLTSHESYSLKKKGMLEIPEAADVGE